MQGIIFSVNTQVRSKTAHRSLQNPN